MTLRDGTGYLAALRDGREVWLGGERVAAVPDHDAFRGCLATLADYYDRQHDPAEQALTFERDGERRSVAWEVPRSAEALLRRRRLIETVSRRNGGTMGRLPEYVPLLLWGLLDGAPALERREPRSSERVERYYRFCSEGDLCLSHSFADPQLDRSRPSGELDRLRIVERRGDDLIVSGAKTVATLAPFSDEYLVLTPPRRGLVAEQALFFAVPVASPGLRLICRRQLAAEGGAGGPLASRFDEMDAWAVFDRVEVPAERVFLAGDVEAVQRAWRSLTVWTIHHLLVRMAVKAEIFLGVCALVTETIGTRVFQNVREELAELVRYLETLRVFVRAAEADCRLTPAGLAAPDARTLTIGHLYAVEHFPRLLRAVAELSGHSLLMAPEETDLASPEVRGALERHYGGVGGLDDKAKLFRLAWDLAGSGFAGRQLLFELFNARSFSQNRLALIERYELAPCEQEARRLAGMEPPPPASAVPAAHPKGGPPR